MLVPVRDANGKQKYVNIDQIAWMEEGNEEGVIELVFVGGKKMALEGSMSLWATTFNKKGRT